MPDDIKIVVLDDDPTGTQTVHGVNVYTDWEEATLKQAFEDDGAMFFVLTNSRSFPHDQTVEVHKEIGRRIRRVAERTHRRALVVSRGDSTLRGHYPAETEALCEDLGGGFDGEFIMPFFPESGRFTRGNVHYVQTGDRLVPAGETEFAKDKTFGYRASHLGEWVEEKTNGRYRAADCLYIPVGADQQTDLDTLLQAHDFQKIIVNAMTYRDVETLVAALWQAIAQGKRYLYRTAAAFPKVLGGVSDQPLLGKSDVCRSGDRNGGLIVVGSHVQKTTQQLQALRDALPDLAYYEFDARQAMRPERAEEMTARALAFAQAAVDAGRTAVIYTSRKRVDLEGVSADEQLMASVRVSRALTAIPARLQTRPRYLIAKGGITSSDVATEALRIRRATVLGQIAAGVPVWKTGAESLFPDLSYIIFPGNVGNENTLCDVVRMLEA